MSFALLVDTAKPARLLVLSEARDSGDQSILAESLLLRITLAGDRARVSESSVKPGSNTNLSFSY